MAPTTAHPPHAAACAGARNCPYCATTRQRHAADIAEILAELAGPLWLTVAIPQANEPHATRALRAWLCDKRTTDAAFWTIERGPRTGLLHVNLLSAAIHRYPHHALHSWTNQIRQPPRNVGAYLAKPSQIPDPATYPGRTLGYTGNLWHHMTATTAHWPAQLAAADRLLQDLTYPLPIHHPRRETAPGRGTSPRPAAAYLDEAIARFPHLARALAHRAAVQPNQPDHPTPTP